MKQRGLRFGIAALSTSIVLLLALVDMRRESPGPLAGSHARVEELAGADGCGACHGGWFSDMTESCLECHAPIAEQIENASGLHGALGARAESCAACHGEHHGEDFDLVNRQSFAQAGVPDVKRFDHAMVGFAMDGKHLELACSVCHERADAKLLLEGERRFLGLEQNCATCHEDVHQGQLVVSCASCHGQSAWDELFSVDHEQRLPLIGGHGDLDCRQCHAEGSAHALEIVGGKQAAPIARACIDCHESPHAPEFVQGVSRIADRAFGASCVECHAPEHASFADTRSTISREQHACSGFALDAPHDDVACADCHSPDALDFAARYPGRDADRCSVCHEDPHGGQFASGPFSTGDCIACHARERFEPHEFTVEKHALAALVLDGKHASAECNECHFEPEPEKPRVFRGTSDQCATCHQDAHQGFFAPFVAGLEPPHHGECARCHATESFSGGAREAFDHARFAGFAIQGSHAQGECEACHPRAEHPDANGRTLGFVAEHFGRFEGCSTCHDDPHEGEFDGPRRPREMLGRHDCARCHDEVSFRSLPYGFDHGAWTDFTLAGAHEAASCSACHAPMRKPDERGRSWGRASGTSCADCHADPHAGQFALAGKTDCARCHVDRAPDFLAFDHERDARFALGEAHRGLDCSACHPTVAKDGLDVVRYRPLGIECADCHGTQEPALLRRKPRRP